MATIEELRERLKKPLLRELRGGCRDDVVLGGVEKLVRTVGRPFADLLEVMRGYANLEPAEREARIERALALLAPQQPSPTTLRPAAAPSQEESAAVRATGFLDHALDERTIELGAQAPRKLAAVGIATFRDLLYYFPHRYEDRRALPHFGALHDLDSATVVGTVTGRKAVKSRRGMVVLRAFLEDRYGGRLNAVWFNQPWLEKQLYPGQRLIVSGKVKRRGRQLEINVAHHEVDEEGEALSAGRIVGIYSSTQGLSQAYIRRAVHRLLRALEPMVDYLPRSVLQRFELAPLDTSLRSAHFPESERQLQQALRRLKFDEFLFLELRVLLSRGTNLLGIRFQVRRRDVETFETSLPFVFTEAQSRALREILDDMKQPRQMARLLQGDVGSGKTVVAAAAVFVATRNGYQAALMAPTEILARQHYLNLTRYLFPLGIRCDLLIGTMTVGERRQARARIAAGEVDLVVGTHALIQEGVEFARLGLAVIDEEHRFGVEQRRKLLKGLPDVLVMSATPIPRSLALTYYGDLELSIIDELPPGRRPVRTRLVSDAKRREVYRFAWSEIQKGRQVYLVTPLIEESEALEGIVSTTQMFEDLRAIMPEGCRIEMLHGRLAGEEKDAIMERFRRCEIDLLVSTR